MEKFLGYLISVLVVINHSLDITTKIKNLVSCDKKQNPRARKRMD